MTRARTRLFAICALSVLTVASFDAQRGLSQPSSNGDGPSETPSISTDGRYIAFASGATNLVPDDLNDSYDVFVRDRDTGVTQLASVSSQGEQGFQDSIDPDISADGRYVAFESNSSGLVPGDGPGDDILLRDLQTGVTSRVSVSSSGQTANAGSADPSVSDDGRYIAFSSMATNLVASDTNGVRDIFVHDRSDAETIRVSIASDGQQVTAAATEPAMSGDATFVAFSSSSATLVPNDTNAVRDVFLHELASGVTERISVGDTGQEASASSRLSVQGGSVAHNAAAVALSSSAPNLVSEDTNNVEDVFVREHEAGFTERISVDDTGAQALDLAMWPAISADGSVVAFDTSSALTASDTNALGDVYVADRPDQSMVRASVGHGGGQGDGDSYGADLAASGTFVAFESLASNLVSNDTNATYDVFVRDLARNRTSRVSVRSDNRAPSARLLVSPTTGSLTTTFTADMSASTDPDGDSLSFEVDWGDGTITQGEMSSHVYAAPDQYTVVGSAADEYGVTTSASSEVAVCAATDATCIPDPLPPLPEDPFDVLPPVARSGPGVTGPIVPDIGCAAPTTWVRGTVYCAIRDDLLPRFPAGQHEYTGTVPRVPCGGTTNAGPRVHVMLGLPDDRRHLYDDADIKLMQQRIREFVDRADFELNHSDRDYRQHVSWACSSVTRRVLVTPVYLVGIADSGKNTSGECFWDENTEGAGADAEGDPLKKPVFTVDDLECSLANQRTWFSRLRDFDFRPDGITGLNCADCDQRATERIYAVFFQDGSELQDDFGPCVFDHDNNVGTPDVSDYDHDANPQTAAVTCDGYFAGGEAITDKLEDPQNWVPGPSNPLNTGPAYTINGNFDGATLLHELFHTIGAVQPSAPNSDGGVHCVDEFDVMCGFEDEPDKACPYFPNWIVDCNRDDYWNPAGPLLHPDASERWNTVNSVFLTDVEER